MSDELRELAVRVLILVVAITWLVLLWRGNQSESAQNFTILGYFTTRDGFPDRAATGETTALIFMSAWGSVMVLRDQMSEWFIAAYVVSFVARGGYAAYLKAAHPTAPGSVTTSSSSSSTTETKTDDAMRGIV